jgi:hypothetical protein
MIRPPQAGPVGVLLTRGDTVEPPIIDVLLLDAQYRQALACIRASSRAGFRTGAVACQSEEWWAAATRSRRCDARAYLPDFADDEHAYAATLTNLVKGNGRRLSTQTVGTVDEARRGWCEIVEAGGEAVVQELLTGRREAVSLFHANGRYRAGMAQVSHRDWPLLGGVSVLCETIPLEHDITEGAERLVEAMNLEGCSMVEFRRDRFGRPAVMEVNPRMGVTRTPGACINRVHRDARRQITGWVSHNRSRPITSNGCAVAYRRKRSKGQR